MPESNNVEQRFGRTWADLVASLWFWLIVAAILIMMYWLDVDDIIGAVPIWLLVAVGMSVIFTPFLYARALEDSQLILVSDRASRISEYRVGSRYGLDIHGHPVQFTSRTGVNRLLLTSFDPETGQGRGTAFEGHTVFDMARDLTVLRRLSEAYSDHLSQERVVKETIGIEVERRVSGYSDQWLRMLYGALDASELEDILEAGPATMNPDDVVSPLEDVGIEPEVPADEVGVDV